MARRPGGLRSKLLRTHMIVMACGVVLLIVALFATLWLRSATLRLLEFRAPTVHAVDLVLQGVNRSLADLRGWTLLGQERFKESRAAAWSTGIQPSIATLRELQSSWPDRDDRRRLEALITSLADLREAQWWIEDVARTPGNQPTRVLYLFDVEPVARAVYASATSMIDLEKTITDGPGRKRFLADMAGFRGAFTRSWGALADYVESMADSDAREFHEFLGQAKTFLDGVAGKSALLTPQLREVLDGTEEEYHAYGELARRLIETGSSARSGQSNVALHLMASDAVPLAEKSTALLSSIALNQDRQMQSDAERVTIIGQVSIVLLVVFIITMALVARLVAVRGADHITGPVESLSLATQQLADGALGKDIPVEGDDEVGQLTRSFNTMRGSLEQKEAALRNEVAHTQAILSTAADGVIVIDRKARVKTFNPAAEELFGLRSDDVLGKNVKLLIPEPFRSEHDHYVADYLRTGTRKIIGTGREVVGQRADGSTFPMWLSVGEMVVDNDKMFVGVVHDMTEEKRAERELEKAKEEAEEGNRAKSEFLANISHELRTPMNGIIGMTELLLSTEHSSEQREYLRIVQRSADALLFLLNEILDFSKVEAGRIELQSGRFELRDTFDEALHAVDFRVFEKGLEIISRVSADVPDDLIGDDVRLRQVLVNLLSNALKFTEEGKIELSVDMLEQSGDQVRLQFAVGDTGIGIPADKLELIFESFRQVDSSTTRRYGGTGLGLTICSELVRLMEGEMWVESTVGSGSTFFFTVLFGVPKPDEKVVNRTEAGEDFGGLKKDFNRVLRVLVAEDNEVNRVLLARMLEKKGHMVETAENGKGALALLDRGIFDLALMDVQMPELDGFETTAAIRKDPRDQVRRLPIIAITAHAMKGFRERCLDAGMDDYVSKPLKRRDVLDAITRVIPSLIQSKPGPVEAATVRSASDPRPLDDLDRKLVLRQVEGDTELLGEVVQIYSDQSAVLLKKIREALASGDSESVAELAHTLKGSSGSLGGLRAAEVAWKLEQMGRDGPAEGLEEMAARLEQEVQKVQTALEKFEQEIRGEDGEEV